MKDQNTAPQAERPLQKTISPLEVEYTRLLAKYRNLEERTNRVEKRRITSRIILWLTCALTVYFCYLCQWVSSEFLLSVCAMSIAIIACSLGILWEKYSNREGDSK